MGENRGVGEEEPAKEGEPADGTDELGFEHVWSLYEKKGNRKTSQRRWANLKKHCREAALKHIPLYVQATPDKQYRKNFETYLNQEAWNDEIVPRGSEDRKHPAVNYGENKEFDEERWKKKMNLSG